jgi:hypothetical protein
MTSSASRPWKSDLVEIALIFAVFCVQGAWPVPDVNEPYYLGKAIHYWDPDWVQGDFFLDSADAQWVFYFAFGWLGLVMSPPVMAWTGRVLTWGLLACSWQRLSWALVPRRGMAVLSGALFACLVECCHMAGEWVIGGVEAKGFAFALVFLGLEAMVRGRWNRAWLLFGAASLWHVLVGGWVVLAAGFAWLAMGPKRPPLRSMLPGLVGGLVISLPSLIPSLTINWGLDPKTISKAHEIYVYYRLPHHLILSEFRWDFLLRFTALVAVWVLLCLAIGPEKGTGTFCLKGPRPTSGRYPASHKRCLSPFPPHGRLRSFVVGALGIALVGAVLSLLWRVEPVPAARLLRFYWFRLSDVAVPLGVALFAVLWIDRLLQVGTAIQAAPRRQSRLKAGTLALAVAAIIAALHVGDYVWLRATMALGLKPAIPRADAKVNSLGGYAAWRDACEWIAASGDIPRDARFLTPIDASTFKWRTRRPEVVNRKEIPQDAASIVTWWERLRDIHGIPSEDVRRFWHASLAELGAERLAELGAKYDAAYVLTEAPGVELPETELRPTRLVPRLNLKTLYENQGYIVYQLRGRQ